MEQLKDAIVTLGTVMAGIAPGTSKRKKSTVSFKKEK
jgi:hypothetical protein